MLLLIVNRYCSDYKDLAILLQFSFVHQVQYAYFVHKSSIIFFAIHFLIKIDSHFVYFCALQRILVALLTRISGNVYIFSSTPFGVLKADMFIKCLTL